MLVFNNSLIAMLSSEHGKELDMSKIKTLDDLINLAKNGCEISFTRSINGYQSHDNISFNRKDLTEIPVYEDKPIFVISDDYDIEGSELFLNDKGKVMRFDSYDAAEKYAQYLQKNHKLRVFHWSIREI